jgi:hypothetical protein
MLGSSWVAAQLATSQEGLSSMSELVKVLCVASIGFLYATSSLRKILGFVQLCNSVEQSSFWEDHVRSTDQGINCSHKTAMVSALIEGHITEPCPGPDVSCPNSHNLLNIKRPPLWSSGQSSWLQILRSRVRFPALPDFLRSSGSGTGSTKPREDNGGATWMKN